MQYLLQSAVKIVQLENAQHQQNITAAQVRATCVCARLGCWCHHCNPCVSQLKLKRRKLHALVWADATLQPFSYLLAFGRYAPVRHAHLLILTGDNMRLLACRFNVRSGAPLARLVWTRLITTLAEKPTWESIAPQQMHLAGHSTADLLRNSTVSSGWRSMKWARGCLSPSSRPCRLDRERYWQRDCSCTCVSMLHSLCAHK